MATAHAHIKYSHARRIENQAAAQAAIFRVFIYAARGLGWGDRYGTKTAILTARMNGG